MQKKIFSMQRIQKVLQLNCETEKRQAFPSAGTPAAPIPLSPAAKSSSGMCDYYILRKLHKNCITAFHRFTGSAVTACAAF